MNLREFGRIDHYLKILKERLKKGDEPAKIKEDIIKEFKDDKVTITNILQKLLKNEIDELQNEIEQFKNKENFTKEDIDKHNIKINEIQRKINIIYQRSNRHITKIMEELNELLEKMDQLLLSYYK